MKLGVSKMTLGRALFILIIAALRDSALFIDEPVAPSSPRWTQLVVLLFVLVPTQMLTLIVLLKKHATHDIPRILNPLLPSLLPNSSSAGVAG